MRKINLLIILYFFTIFSTVSATNQNFDEWLVAFKIKAKNQGISEKTISNSIGESLKRLRRDSIDVFLAHEPCDFDLTNETEMLFQKFWFDFQMLPEKQQQNK